jgi:hypothetical protein
MRRKDIKNVVERRKRVLVSQNWHYDLPLLGFFLTYLKSKHKKLQNDEIGQGKLTATLSSSGFAVIKKKCILPKEEKYKQ